MCGVVAVSPFDGDQGERGVDIEKLDTGAPTVDHGGKARHIRWLFANGERVPETWVVGPAIPHAELVAAVDFLPDGDSRYAVRSSATVEDGAESSFAGQFVSELDVARDGIVAAVDRVRESATSERVLSYEERLATGDGIAMSVIVQPMVPAQVSGVSFSRNPMTGLNEVVVEAVSGRGDRLVDDGVTPDRWIRRWGSWIEEPDSPVLDSEVALAIAEDTARIAEAFGAPVDLEWVWDGAELWWVQLRPITGIHDVAVYSNRISREVMPGIIKPLVWSVNVPMVNAAWVDLFTEALGANDLRPEDLAKAFAYRSYFNMGAIGEIFELFGMPRDSLEVLLGLPGDEKPSFKPGPGAMRRMPRLLLMAARKSRYGKRVPGELAELKAGYRPFDVGDLTVRSDTGLLEDLAALQRLGVRAAYANIITPLLANLYSSLLRRRLAKAGLDPEEVEAVPGTAALADVNPNVHLDTISDTVGTLDGATREAIREGGHEALPDGLRADIDRFLARFGHLSSSGNDFSVPTWREQPDAVVTMALDHAATHGTGSRIPWEEASSELGVWSRALARPLRKRTQAYIEHRERISFTYTYGYGLFRRYFLEIGRRLMERRVLDAATDVMFLYLDEVRTLLLGDALDVPAAELAASRKAEIESVRDVVMPEVVYGDDFVPSRAPADATEVTGIPTSRGHHRGTLRLVRDTGDFSKVQPGDVIAIPFSDVGWTPLFARAGAVVAEAGGMLSHSSIVAREYRIPCVVSVAGALQLPDGATVTVDGYAGTVVVESDP